jgi:hypothetical protein
VVAHLFCAGGRTDRHDEANSRFSQFYGRAHKSSKNCPVSPEYQVSIKPIRFLKCWWQQSHRYVRRTRHTILLMRLAQKERDPLSSFVVYLTKSYQFQHLISLSELDDKIPLAVKRVKDGQVAYLKSIRTTASPSSYNNMRPAMTTTCYHCLHLTLPAICRWLNPPLITDHAVETTVVLHVTSECWYNHDFQNWECNRIHLVRITSSACG